MQPERWQQIDRLFHLALEQERGQRSVFLAQACANDEALRSEIEELISCHEQSDNFIETPASDLAAELLAKGQARANLGESIGPYRLESVLGIGGMGEVYLAQDTRLGRQVALKLLPPHFTINPERVRRFEQEARAASALNHPNIVTIHEVGRFNSAQFIITEFVEGRTLRQLMNEKPFTLNEALNVSIQIGGALTAAHAAGIVHRDIKPENIMLRTDGYVKILDFGLAKLTERVDSGTETSTLAQSNPGLVMGTVQYMSPEQARGNKIDGRTDIWSLGVVLYELLTGRVPFSGETPSHVMVSVMEDEPPPLGDCARVPVELDRIVTKSLCKLKKERYQTAPELVRDLKNLKQELRVAGQSKGSLEAVPGSKKRATGAATGAQASSLAMATATETVALQSHPTSTAEYLVSEIKRQKRGVAITTAAAVILLAAFAYFYFNRNHSRIPGGEAIESIAVLPFVNVSNDPNTEYLSEGISDSVINSLSRLPSLQVTPLNAVLRYKGKQIDPQTIGKALNVRAVLMGRLTQQGDRLLISTELVDVRDNRRLWGEQYNRKLADVIIVQTEIAQEISQNLRLRLSPQDQKQLAKRDTENAEAYRLYMLGVYSHRGNPGKEQLEASIRYFEQAIKIDPQYALAYVGLALVYRDFGFRGFWIPKDASQKAEWAALKAVELDDTLAEAHSALAAEMAHRDWAGAEKEAKRALELDPNSAEVNTRYALYLAFSVRGDEALVYAARAEQLNSSPSGRPAQLPFIYFLARKYEIAIEGYRKALEKNPNSAHIHFFLGEVYLVKGMYQEGVAELQKAVAIDNAPERWDRYPVLAYAYAVSGKRDEALKILNQQQRLAKQRYISPYNLAIIYTGLGDKDRAFEVLNRAVDEDSYMMTQVPARPMFDSLRSDPRYPALLRRMNRTL